MRIIGGSRRGHRLFTPRGLTTRPTQDRVRESIFNVLSSHGWDGTRVLDAFAGTGAYALEALSRGAESAVAIDLRTAALIRRNAEHCRFTAELQVIPGKATAVLERLAAEGAPPFTCIFLDPPYRQNLVRPVLQVLAERGLAVPGALLVVEHAGEETGIADDTYRLIKEKNYGDTTVSYLEFQGGG